MGDGGRKVGTNTLHVSIDVRMFFLWLCPSGKRLSIISWIHAALAPDNILVRK